MPSRFPAPRRIENPATGDGLEYLTAPLGGERGPRNHPLIAGGV